MHDDDDDDHNNDDDNDNDNYDDDDDDRQTCANLTEVVRVAADAAAAQNSLLYVGEYGGPK